MEHHANFHLSTRKLSTTVVCHWTTSDYGVQQLTTLIKMKSGETVEVSFKNGLHYLIHVVAAAVILYMLKLQEG